MKKISYFMIEFSEVFKDRKLDYASSKPPKKLMNRFVKIIKKEVTDPRYEKMCTYPLELILCVVFLAVLGDFKTWGEIADFGNIHKKWLSRFLPIKDRMPIDDTYQNVFSKLDSKQLSRATIKFITELFEKIIKTMDKHKPTSSGNYRLVNIDGKVARGSGRMYNTENEVRNLETLNVYEATRGICLFSLPISDKTNEIPVAQDIIKQMNLKKTIVTLDALHAQHLTFDAIINKKGDFLIGIKGNQKDAFEEINLLLTDEELDKLRRKQTKDKAYHKQDKTKKNGKKTIKEYFKIPFEHFAIEQGETNEGVQKWRGVKNIICYKYTSKTTDTINTRYFCTSLNDLDLIVEAIIGRWDVENKLHKYLDISFGEDANKTMDLYAQNNLSIINKLCLSILKIAKPIFDNRSMVRIKKFMGSKPREYLSLILNTISPSELEKIMLEKIS